MKWLRKNLTTILLVVVLLIGLCLLVYPTFSDWWNSLHQSQAIASYTESVSQIDNTAYQKMLAEANTYNQNLVGKMLNWMLTDAELEKYNSILNISDSGVMCAIEIPKIKCSLPIYHGTDEDILQVAVGHIAGTSFPVGGEGTHAVLSGHRGLPSARLFTDLDRLVTGDVFLIEVLDEILTYEVDQILIVEPYDLSALEIEEGKDLVTLVTCTPYGVNSHRLLVRGHRIETEKKVAVVRVTADAVQIEPNLVAPVVAAPILLLLLLLLMVTSRSGRKRKSK